MTMRHFGPPAAPYDLHNHTARSKDGQASPEEIIDIAAARGLKGLGVCDHDVLPDESLYAHARSRGIRLALGVEISCARSHVIGFGLDLSCPALKELEARFELLARNIEPVTRALLRDLGKQGVRVSYEELQAYAGKPPQKVFLLKYLAEELRLFPSWSHARRHLLQMDAYLPDDAGIAPLHPARAVEIVKAAGGFSVWAHPFFTPEPLRRDYLRDMLDAGLNGIEGAYLYRENGHKGPEGNEELAARARAMIRGAKVHLLGGSDSHYPLKTHPDLTPILPGDCGLDDAEARCLEGVLR